MIKYQCIGSIPKFLSSLDLTRIARACSRLKKSVVSKPHIVSVQFVAASKIQMYNRIYRGKNIPTDVLSFRANEKSEEIFPVIRESMTEVDLGDLIICPSIVRTEAKRRSVDLEEELIRMLVHGTLHLMGYDHDTDVKERKMFGLQEELVERMTSA
jgi:probable rRNA maturation factor